MIKTCGVATAKSGYRKYVEMMVLIFFTPINPDSAANGYCQTFRHIKIIQRRKPSSGQGTTQQPFKQRFFPAAAVIDHAENATTIAITNAATISTPPPPAS